MRTVTISWENDEGDIVSMEIEATNYAITRLINLADEINGDLNYGS